MGNSVWLGVSIHSYKVRPCLKTTAKKNGERGGEGIRREGESYLVLAANAEFFQ